MKTTYTYEHTDTLGGEANYCWVNRGKVTVKEGASPVRAAKRALGYTGVRCRVGSWGDCIAVYPAGECTVIFITREEGAL